MKAMNYYFGMKIPREFIAPFNSLIFINPELSTSNSLKAFRISSFCSSVIFFFYFDTFLNIRFLLNLGSPFSLNFPISATYLNIPVNIIF